MKVLLVALAVAFLLPRSASAQTRGEQVRMQVREILASPEFRAAPAEPSLLDRAFKRIGKLIDELFERLGRLFGMRSGGAGGNIAFWLILIALLVGMGLLIAYAVRRLELRKAAARPRVTDTAESEPDSNQPEDWLALSQTLAARGDFRRAYRAMFRALLLRLDAGGIIRFEASRTNGEYIRSLRPNAKIHGIVRPAAEGFDLVWYGRRPATEQDFQSCRSAYESVDSALSA